MKAAIINESHHKYKERFLVIAGKKVKSIPVSQVAYFVSEGRYITLVTKSNHNYLLDYSLDKVAKKLNPLYFFRVNRQFLISFDAIIDMTIWSRSRFKIMLQPQPKEDVITSMNKSVQFRQWLDR